MRFPPGYNSGKLFCERPERKEKLEQVISHAAGRIVRLDFELEPGEVVPGPPSRAVSRQEQKRKVTSHPLVERAMELFDAEVLGAEGPPEGPVPPTTT